MKRRGRLLSLLVVALLAAPGPARAAEVIVGFPPGNPDPDSQFPIDVSVDVGADTVLGSYNFVFRYDPTVVTVVSIGGGSTSEFSTAPTTDPSTFASGMTPFAFAQPGTTSPKNTVSVATVTLQAAHLSSASSNLDVKVVSLYDAETRPIVATEVGSSVLTKFVPGIPTTSTTTTTTSSTTTTTTTTTTTSTTATSTTITSTTTSTSVTTTTGSATSTTAAPTTTTISPTTTTTAPPRRVAEVCGNCIDDDGDGRTDYEDPACCADTASMQVTQGRFLSGKGGVANGKLKLGSILAPAGFGTANPVAEDVTIQLRNRNGELLCVTVPHTIWRKRRGTFAFHDGSGALGGLTTGQIRIAKKSGAARFTAAGRGIDLGRFDQSELDVTVRIGGRCSRGTASLHQTKKGLVFP